MQINSKIGNYNNSFHGVKQKSTLVYNSINTNSTSIAEVSEGPDPYNGDNCAMSMISDPKLNCDQVTIKIKSCSDKGECSSVVSLPAILAYEPGDCVFTDSNISPYLATARVTESLNADGVSLVTNASVCSFTKFELPLQGNYSCTLNRIHIGSPFPEPYCSQHVNDTLKHLGDQLQQVSPSTNSRTNVGEIAGIVVVTTIGVAVVTCLIHRFIFPWFKQRHQKQSDARSLNNGVGSSYDAI